jgi:hypothetical protein
VLLLLERAAHVLRKPGGNSGASRNFLQPFSGEIFEGHFETALWIFRDASIFRRNWSGPQSAPRKTPAALRPTLLALARGVFCVLLVS